MPCDFKTRCRPFVDQHRVGSPFLFDRVKKLPIFFAAGLLGLVFWELRHRNPVVNFRPLGERNFAGCCIVIFCAYLALYAASTSIAKARP
jgi:MFS transporter, DHA2 family, multidrug resistance protein